MLINLFIDNNVWEFCIENNIDINNELPSSEFCLYITKEAVFEICDKTPQDKKVYVQSLLDMGRIKTDTYFGFYDENHSDEKQRVAGFGEENDPNVGGRFIEEDESILLQNVTRCIGSQKKPATGLYKHEADASLAARSLHAVVLTRDKNKGPLKKVKMHLGGIVINLDDWKKDISIASFIKAEITRLSTQKS
jgi:hypothetical protein